MLTKDKSLIPLSDPSRELQYIKNYFPSIQKEIKSGVYIGGKNVEQLENKLAKFFDIKYVASLNSGTDALACAIYSLDIGKGDEVILPSFTFFATAEVVINSGATPVFADVELETQCISLDKIKPLVTNKTKCIIPVHLYGNNSDIENIKNFCSKKKIYLIEDCAQSFGSATKSNKKLGTFGNVNAFSTYPSKTLGGIGDGGFITTNNKSIYQAINKYKNHGQTKTYDHVISGINSRMDSVNAFTLLKKLEIFNQIKDTRNDAVKFYNNIFNNFNEIQSFNNDKKTIYNYYTIQLPPSKRGFVQEELRKDNIFTSIYYKKPLHKQKSLVDYGFKFKDLTNTNKLSKSVLSLPLYAFMTKKEKSYLQKSIKKVLKKHDIN